MKDGVLHEGLVVLLVRRCSCEHSHKSIGDNMVEKKMWLCGTLGMGKESDVPSASSMLEQAVPDAEQLIPTYIHIRAYT